MTSSPSGVVDIGSRMRTPTVHQLAHQDDSSAFRIVDVRSLTHEHEQVSPSRNTRRGQSRRRMQHYRRQAPTSPQSPGPAISNEEIFNFSRSVGTLTSEHGAIRLCRQCYQYRFCRRHSEARQRLVTTITMLLSCWYRSLRRQSLARFATSPTEEFIPLRPEFQLPSTHGWDDVFLALFNANILNFVPYAAHGELSSA